MKKLFILTYGVITYVLGSGALVCLIAFVFNLLPFGIDDGMAGNTTLAFAINLALIALFGVQHSIMARPWIKQKITRHIPGAAERSTFMLATAVVVFTLIIFWQPIPAVVWQAENTVTANMLLAIGLLGWALVFYATFLINHFDLFGLRQVWLYFRGREYTPLPFRLNSLYKHIRHPIMTGVFIGIWFTPTMTVGHLVFALGMSAYILIGVYHEEKDLIKAFGGRYQRYMGSTGRFAPRLRKQGHSGHHTPARGA